MAKRIYNKCQVIYRYCAITRGDFDRTIRILEYCRKIHGNDSISYIHFGAWEENTKIILTDSMAGCL